MKARYVRLYGQAEQRRVKLADEGSGLRISFEVQHDLVWCADATSESLYIEYKNGLLPDIIASLVVIWEQVRDRDIERLTVK